MNWLMNVGPRSVIGVRSAAEIVAGRLEYIVEHGSRCNQARLLSEALEYATLLRTWARDNEPRTSCVPYDPADHVRGSGSGKPGLMSDG